MCTNKFWKLSENSNLTIYIYHISKSNGFSHSSISDLPCFLLYDNIWFWPAISDELENNINSLTIFLIQYKKM